MECDLACVSMGDKGWEMTGGAEKMGDLCLSQTPVKLKKVSLKDNFGVEWLTWPCGLLKSMATTQSTIWFRGASVIPKWQFWNVELVVWLPSKRSTSPSIVRSLWGSEERLQQRWNEHLEPSKASSPTIPIIPESHWGHQSYDIPRDHSATHSDWIIIHHDIRIWYPQISSMGDLQDPKMEVR